MAAKAELASADSLLILGGEVSAKYPERGYLFVGPPAAAGTPQLYQVVVLPAQAVSTLLAELRHLKDSGRFAGQPFKDES